MERKVPSLLYKHPVRHQERGVCCRSTFRDAWTQPAARSGEGRMSVSRGMASSPFERTPRELGLARIPWNGREFQGGAFSVYQKELSGTCGEGDSVLQSRGNSHQADKSDESNSRIYLRWFLGVNERCSKRFFELQPPPVICKMTEGDPKTRWS